MATAIAGSFIVGKFSPMYSPNPSHYRSLSPRNTYFTNSLFTF